MRYNAMSRFLVVFYYTSIFKTAGLVFIHVLMQPLAH